jgi:hypothetical protein
MPELLNIRFSFLRRTTYESIDKSVGIEKVSYSTHFVILISCSRDF